jgi:sarcosine oxidase subunit gamma
VSELQKSCSALNGAAEDEGVQYICSATGTRAHELGNLALVQISQPGEHARRNREAAEQVLGGVFPMAPNTTSDVPNGHVLWLGPGRWLASISDVRGTDLESSLMAACDRVAGSVVDISHGRAVVRLEGKSAREILSKGCPLDVHPRSFVANSCAQSTLERVPILLHLVSENPIFDLYFPRSYAAWLWQWLVERGFDSSRLNAETE